MALLRYTRTNDELSHEQQQQLLKIARQSIEYGCEHGARLQADHLLYYPASLTNIGCCFVTLTAPQAKGAYELRGCIGSLTASQPLLKDVVEHAYAAAFQDSRFPPVTTSEVAHLHIEISVLSPQQPLQFRNEAELLKQLQPHKDGLAIEYDGRRATFLPSVWAQLSEPAEFLGKLKQKAGFADDFWSSELRAYRYSCQSFEEGKTT